jgi:hypothetical protein
MKINQGSKDIVLDSYQPYNRYNDPHLQKYLGRKKKIAQNDKESIRKTDYYANGMQNKGYTILDQASISNLHHQGGASSVYTPSRPKGKGLVSTPLNYRQ